MTSHPFKLINELYTNGYRQKHPCTCGPSSMALAAHSVGMELLPEKAWLDPIFSAWVPVEQFTKRGMSLQELQFVSEYIYQGKIEITMTRAFDHNYEKFRKELIHSANNNNTAMVINFTQDYLLDQINTGPGSPHFSIISGFDEAKNLVRIADIDMEVETIYTASTEEVFQSMAFINPAFGLPRGWLKLALANK